MLNMKIFISKKYNTEFNTLTLQASFLTRVMLDVTEKDTMTQLTSLSTPPPLVLQEAAELKHELVFGCSKA